MSQTSINEAQALLNKIKAFIPSVQFQAISEFLRGEEGSFFAEKIAEYADRIEHMPETYDQDGLGDEALVYLHYFGSSGDFYITEKDKCGDGTQQAFGYVILGGDLMNAELGYISIEELRGIPFMELDLHFEPKPLREIKQAV